MDLGEKMKGVENIVAVASHPDDIEFFAGGTVAKYSRLSKNISEIILSEGRRGILSGLTPNELGKVRKKEAERGAEVLGIGKVVFLDGRFNELQFKKTEENVRYLEENIRILNPDIILCPTYEACIDFWNPDHKITGRLVERAAKRLNKQVLFYGTFMPDYIEDIDQYRLIAEEALEQHKSQLQALGKFYIHLRRRVLRYFGNKNGSEYGEPFKE